MAFIEYQWKRYLKYIFEQGHAHTKDDSEIQEVLGYHTQILSPINSRWVSGEKGEELFLNAIKGGTFNIPNYPIKDEALYKYVTAWDQDDMINCDNFVYTYPERLFNYPINQYEIIKNRLLNNLGSNRGVAVLYNPFKDGEREDIPCLNWLQATVRDGKLMLHCMFRSNDIYGAWPSNMMLLSYLGIKLANELDDVVFHGIDYHCSSAHYYKTDEDAVKKIVGVE